MRFGQKEFESFAIADPFEHTDHRLKAGGGTVVGGGSALWLIKMAGVCGTLIDITLVLEE